jgi:transcriptional regulator with XRE-family HTH domain
MYNGNNIKLLAERNGMMLKDVYMKAQINQSTFFQIIGENGNPKADKLESIANVLDCSIDDFFDRCYRQSNSITQNGGLGNAASVYGNAATGELDNANLKISHLEQLLEEKEKQIQLLRKICGINE